MKVLLAIMTCAANAHRREAVCETWMPEALAAGWEVEFFDGPRLGVVDDYARLIEKTQALCRWAIEREYDWLMKIDDDAYIGVPYLKVPEVDYAGLIYHANDGGSPRLGIPPAPAGTYPFPYAVGGGYWLSRRAMRLVAEAQPNGDWAEDRFVGQVLAGHGIYPAQLPGYEGAWSEPFSQYLGRRYALLVFRNDCLEQLRAYHAHR